MKDFPEIDLNEFEGYRKENEKLQGLEAEREGLKAQLHDVRAEIEKRSRMSDEEKTGRFLKTGQMPDTVLEPLQSQASSLEQRLDFYHNVIRAQGKKVEHEVRHNVQPAIMERIMPAFAEARKERVEALCTAALAGARELEIVRHFKGLHRDLSFPYTVSLRPTNLTLGHHNEPLRHQIAEAVKSGFLTLSDLPAEAVEALGMEGYIKARERPMSEIVKSRPEPEPGSVAWARRLGLLVRPSRHRDTQG